MGFDENANSNNNVFYDTILSATFLRYICETAASNRVNFGLWNVAQRKRNRLEGLRSALSMQSFYEYKRLKLARTTEVLWFLKQVQRI